MRLLKNYHDTTICRSEAGLIDYRLIEEVIVAPLGIPADTYATPLDALGYRHGRQLLELDAQQLIAVRNMGQKSVEEILTQLRSHGYGSADPET